MEGKWVTRNRGQAWLERSQLMYYFYPSGVHLVFNQTITKIEHIFLWANINVN